MLGKKMKTFVVFLGLLFVFPFSVSAQCDYERQAELSRIASNIKLSYSYDADENGYPIFTVNMINATDDVYVVDYREGTIVNDFEHNFVYNDNGVTLRYDVMSNDINCQGQKILTKNITLPRYNRFSQLARCEEYPSFKYCQIWFNSDAITQDIFDTELDKYVKKFEGKVTDSDSQSNSDIVVDFIRENLLWIFAVVSLIGLLIVFIYLKRKV